MLFEKKLTHGDSSDEMVAMCSALSQEGLKEEALSVLEVAVKWDRSIEVYIKQLQLDLDGR